MAVTRREIVDNLDELLAVLPSNLQPTLRDQPDLSELIEIILDLGRAPEARFAGRCMYLSEEPVTRDDLNYVVKRVGEFGQDNRAGIERTLHRISAIRNRRGEVIGLTCRIGRAVFGTIDIVEDVVKGGESLLLVGPPGVGKTTMLREVARVLADDFGKRVIVVDTSNEIAGDGDIPHPGIGHARRMQVPRVDKQAEVMIEAVENHMPEVIIIDEIGTEAEARAARTIAERGVQLIGTAHGVNLENLIANPTLSDLVGGVQAVILGDEEARKRGTQKTVLERKAPPTFPVVIEIQEKNRFAIHHDVAKTVDLYLRGLPMRPEVRERDPQTGEIKVVTPAPAVAPGRGPGLARDGKPGGEAFPSEGKGNGRLVWPWEKSDGGEESGEYRRGRPERGHEEEGDFRQYPFLIYPYGVSRNRLEKAIAAQNRPAAITEDLDLANCVITLKGQYRKMPKRLREAERSGLPIYTLRSNTQTQMENLLAQLFGKEDESALEEARAAVEAVLAGGGPVELQPQNSYVRMLQHELARQYNLRSASSGQGQKRHVVIYPR